MTCERDPAFLPNAVTVRCASVAELASLHTTDRQPRRYYSLKECPVRSAILSQVTWDNGALWYSEVRGGLVNIGSAAGSEMILGLPVSGALTVDLNNERHSVSKPGGLLVLPGDLAVQVMRDSGIFSLRIPLSREEGLALKARSFRARQRVSRVVPSDQASDLIRLVGFAASEFDRKGDSREVGEQGRAIGHALIERARAYLESIIAFPAPQESQLLRICLDSDAVITEDPRRSYSVETLASRTNCSVRQLYRAFEAVAETTPADYQVRVRLNYGRSLLVAEPLESDRLGRVAHRCGFTSTSRFAGAYEAEFDETPAKTRQTIELLLSEFLGTDSPTAMPKQTYRRPERTSSNSRSA